MAAPMKSPYCPTCGGPLRRRAPGWWACPQGHGEWLGAEGEVGDDVTELMAVGSLRPDPPDPPADPLHALIPWLPRKAARAAEPVSRAEVGTRRKGGGRRGRGKSPQQQKMDAWQRRRKGGGAA
ncbi:hypothetical protein [Caldinitratiruptor microaerophilus]|uniref:Uncharacterized protein n=1 Tax=Caldinitratiruptor microaerophilus TaxID=671077 RepID=A0AA35G7S3_9FIRM|nr:hypothetical protein [Caldinitratiruptor microaerophilus]BDG59628.1 hypothetical protein caldi_07180 [Caldinitratiruptor microaerophilus]